MHNLRYTTDSLEQLCKVFEATIILAKRTLFESVMLVIIEIECVP